MNTFLNKLFFRLQKPDYINIGIKKIFEETDIKIIFEAINTYNDISEIRYVGGCVRKIINREKIDDIDLATNLNPKEICDALTRNNINFFESGIDHGTVTALIDKQKFEITSLRKDISTDGRHAKVKFTKNWKEDALRRDFTINSIYADKEGNLFDPLNGKKDLENGKIEFIGESEKRIKEDYLRILRYVRFFLNYSKEKHDERTLKKIRKNLDGVLNLSSERLLDELQKIIRSKNFLKLSKDQNCLDIIELIFPQLKNISVFNKLNIYAKENLDKVDFTFLLALMLIDDTDNLDYFIYKFKLSKKDQKRLLLIYDFYKSGITLKSFSENNLNLVLYFNGKEALIDIINFKIFKSKKIDQNLVRLIEIYKDKKIPQLPVKTNLIMSKYNLVEGKKLGNKLKEIEIFWVKNNFQISDEEVEKIINN
jgi:tRNA nucleotidyltransferase/poly(A) polymerase